jgi:hypothetical protein
MAKGAWARVFSNGSWIPWMGMPEALLGSRPLSEKDAIKLTSPDIWLTESAGAAFDLLVEGVHASKIMDSILDCYKFYFKLYGERNDLKPRKIEQSDRDRLLFEILCFATFNIVVRVVPRYIIGKFSTKDHVSNSRNVYHFNQRFPDCLDKFFNARKFTAIRELVITGTSPKSKCGPGERLSAAKRMARYLNAGSIEEELRIFSNSVGYAIDPLSLQITEVIGLSHTGVVLGIISKTLKAVF